MLTSGKNLSQHHEWRRVSSKSHEWCWERFFARVSIFILLTSLRRWEVVFLYSVVFKTKLFIWSFWNFWKFQDFSGKCNKWLENTALSSCWLLGSQIKRIWRLETAFSIVKDHPCGLETSKSLLFRSHQDVVWPSVHGESEHFWHRTGLLLVFMDKKGLSYPLLNYNFIHQHQSFQSYF